MTGSKVDTCAETLQSVRPVPPHAPLARFVSALGLPEDDHEVRDVLDMLDAALTAARQAGTWELFDDALDFAHGRFRVRSLADVLAPAQHEVGRLWAAGVVSIVQERFCTAVTQFVMTDLYQGFVNADPHGRRLVAVHASGSTHHLGLRMVADVLECEGWITTYLSHDLSVEELIEVVVDEHADLLLVSVSMPSQLPPLSALIAALRRDPRTRGVKVVVGGRPFLVAPALVDAVGADGWAPDARSAVRVCDRLTGGGHDR